MLIDAWHGGSNGSDHKSVGVELRRGDKKDRTTPRLAHHIEEEGEMDPPPLGEQEWCNELCEYEGYSCAKRARKGKLVLCMRHGGGHRCPGIGGVDCEKGNGVHRAGDLCKSCGGGHRCPGKNGVKCPFDYGVLKEGNRCRTCGGGGITAWGPPARGARTATA